jgi:MATE family multidrug resistance protein
LNQKNEKLYAVLSSWKFDFRLMRQFLKFGLPSGLQWALEGLAFTVFLIIMGRLPNGEAALASSSIAVTVMMLSVLPSMGVAQAVLTLVGQNLGENNPARAEKTTLMGVRIAAMYMASVALTFVFFPQFYLSWFENSNNPTLWAQVTHLAPTLLKIVAGFTIFDSIYLNISFALKGAGDTRFISFLALVVPWPIMVLPAYLVQGWENAVIWAWSFVILYSVSITSLIYWRFKQGKWKNMRVV